MPRAVPKPVPAFYAVYVLRSLKKRNAYYVGSTPDPPRRLRQHNGDRAGGAGRTSREDKRPWEMIGLVSGFPGMIAALRFEWALEHPHLTAYIPPEQRLAGGRRKPPKTMSSLVQNVHLLLRSPSFARWPLKLHFFSAEFHGSWRKWTSKLPPEEHIRSTIPTLTDFSPPGTDPASTQDPPSTQATSEPPASSQRSPSRRRKREPSRGGIHALPVDYEHLRNYVDKARSVFAFERADQCAFCAGSMTPGKGLYAVCPNDECEAVGHLTCWSRHLLAGERGGANQHLIPLGGDCISCKRSVAWEDMMKEMTLRMRGPKEVEKLLDRGKRKVKGAGPGEEGTDLDDGDEDDGEDDDDGGGGEDDDDDDDDDEDDDE